MTTTEALLTRDYSRTLKMPLDGRQDRQDRVVILCSTLWSIRNVVLSGLLEKLKSLSVTPFLLVSQNFAQPAAKACAGAEGLSRLRDASLSKSKAGKALLDDLLFASFARRYEISSYAIFNEWLKRNQPRSQNLRSLLVNWFSRLGCRDFFYHWQIENLERFIRDTRDFTPIREQLVQLNPSLVMTTNCTTATECQYLRVAQDLDIPTLNWVLSFDNLTSRGRLPKADFYAVWNDRMKAQVLRLYPELKTANVQVTGTTQFDFHVRKNLRWNREATLRRLGLKQDDRYLLYAANSAYWTPSEPTLVAEFARRLEVSADLNAHRIIVRLHPLDDFNRWRQIETIKGRVVISRPWDQDGNGFDIEDQALLVNSLLHADVCINMASTMSLDAAVLDTPVVCAAFAGQSGGAEDRFCKRAYHTEHYRPLVESGGLRVAENMDQLLAEVSAYARNRERDGSGRQQLALREVGQVDGHASERVASFVAGISRPTCGARRASLGN